MNKLVSKFIVIGFIFVNLMASHSVIACPSISSIDKNETRFSGTKDLVLRACYLKCDDSSADAWEMSYCGADCENSCTLKIVEEKLSICIEECKDTSADAWEMAYCGADCEKKYKIK